MHMSASLAVAGVMAWHGINWRKILGINLNMLGGKPNNSAARGFQSNSLAAAALAQQYGDIEARSRRRARRLLISRMRGAPKNEAPPYARRLARTSAVYRILTCRRGETAAGLRRKEASSRSKSRNMAVEGPTSNSARCCWRQPSRWYLLSSAVCEYFRRAVEANREARREEGRRLLAVERVGDRRIRRYS